MNAIKKEIPLADVAIHKDLAEVHADFIKREKEAAKDPNHPNHDALKAYFAETERKLAEIKKNAKKN